MVKLLRPFAKMLGPWPTVALVAILLVFLMFGEYHIFRVIEQVLSIGGKYFQSCPRSFSFWWDRLRDHQPTYCEISRSPSQPRPSNLTGPRPGCDVRAY